MSQDYAQDCAHPSNHWFITWVQLTASLLVISGWVSVKCPRRTGHVSFILLLGWISQLLGSLVADLELAKLCVLQLYIELSASCKANVFMGWGEVVLRKILAGTTGVWAKPSAGRCQEQLPLWVQLKTQYLRAVGTVWCDWYGTGITADQDNFPVLLTTSISTKTNQNPSIKLPSTSAGIENGARAMLLDLLFLMFVFLKN